MHNCLLSFTPASWSLPSSSSQARQFLLINSLLYHQQHQRLPSGEMPAALPWCIILETLLCFYHMTVMASSVGAPAESCHLHALMPHTVAIFPSNFNLPDDADVMSVFSLKLHASHCCTVSYLKFCSDNLWLCHERKEWCAEVASTADESFSMTSNEVFISLIF